MERGKKNNSKNADQMFTQFPGVVQVVVEKTVLSSLSLN